MTLSEVRKAAREGLKCYNCNLYSWEQAPGLPSSLTRCSRCRTLHYCSKECQEEHWVKVHKDQCQLLSRQSQPFMLCSKELVGKIDFMNIDLTVHDTQWCSVCKKDAEEGLAKPGNPRYGCHVTFSMPDWEEGPRTIPWGSKDLEEDIRTKLPFDIYKLEDLKSGAEKILWLLQALLFKLKVTKYPMARSQDRLSLIELRKVLQIARVKTWLVYMTVPRETSKLEYESSTTVVNILGQANYENIMTSVKMKSGVRNEFGLWDIFKLLSEFLLNSDVVACELASLDQLGLDEFPAEYRSVVEAARATASLTTRDSVVATLTPHLKPFIRVVELLCGGLQQRCSNCKEEITIGAVYYSVDDQKLPSLPFVTIGIVRKFCCTSKLCGKKVIAERKQDFRILHSLIRAMRAKFIGSFCDACFMVGKESHRCSGCLTKVYCSQDCLQKDWAVVHRKICARSKEEVRKVKEGRRGRKEEGKHRIEGWVDCHNKAFGKKSVMDKVVEKMEKM
eukprot:GFUD01001038.1.p1 GENE.GFUD01001038.1~~GFUD01001038.1.p1  ORF type:complete len:505 (+),score=143.91 GFUD01001038.1:63-1577(+)